MYTISILVPVYNVEPYIERCIRSIQEQTFKDFECIVVDDCTPDKSMEIVYSIVQNDSRFRIIHHEVNKGVGEARNTLIRNAEGEYVTFIDSDDYVEPEYLEQLYNAITTSQAEIVNGMFGGGQYSNTYHASTNNKAKDHHAIIVKHLLESTHYGVVNKLYKRYLFNNITFYPRYYEDISATLCLLMENKIVEIPQVQVAGYNYELRRGSITHSCSSEHIDDFVENVLQIHITKLSQHGYEQTYLQKYLCLYVLWKVDSILRMISRHSLKPHIHFAHLKSRIHGTIPQFTSTFFQIHNLFVFISNIKHFYMNSHVLYSPLVRLSLMGSIILFPIIRSFLRGSIFWAFLYKITDKYVQFLTRIVKKAV